jgi:hypothetical protein
MDPIARLKAFISRSQQQLAAYLEQHQVANRAEAHDLMWETLNDTCHQIVDRREAYVRTRRRGAVRPVWQVGRSLNELYERLTVLSQASEWAQSQVEAMIDDMIICFEQAIEYFIRGAELWREAAA